MSLVTRSAAASMDANQSEQFAAGNLYAGEDLDMVAPCYIKAADGKVYMSNGTNNDEAATFVGFTARSCRNGEPVTLFGDGTRFRYSTGMTPGAVLYIGTTKGRLDTAPTTGDLNGVAAAVNATDIVVRRSAVVNLQTVPDNSFNAQKVGNTASGNVIGGVPVLHRFDLPAGANANTDSILTYKTRIIRAWAILQQAGIASETVQVKNGNNAITSTIAVSGSDQTSTDATTIDDAYWDIAAGGTLRVTSAGGASQPMCTVFVLGIRVP